MSLADTYENSTDDPVTDYLAMGYEAEMQAAEFFAGAGGTSVGLKRAGIRVAVAYDFWAPALKTYRKNVGSHAFFSDIRARTFDIAYSLSRVKLDIIAGSPPCQDFSMAGQRVEKDNALLTQAYAILIGAIRPEWILMENVPEAGKSRTWKEARALLKRYGYGLTEMVLNAAHYGTPQARKRLIVVGRLGEADGFLTSAIREVASKKPTTVRDMLIPGLPEDDALRDIGYFFVRPYTGGRGVRSIDEPCTTVIRTTGAAPEPKYLRNPHPNDPIPATQAHVLTEGQVSRIQGFPPEWDWSPSGSKKDRFQAIANAVPPCLAEAVGRVILARHRQETLPAIEEQFSEWLQKRGFSQAAVRNCKSRINRARRMLGGRTFADAAIELARLDSVEAFATLPTGTRSDLRAALRLYRKWKVAPKVRRKGEGEAAEAMTVAA